MKKVLVNRDGYWMFENEKNSSVTGLEWVSFGVVASIIVGLVWVWASMQ